MLTELDTLKPVPIFTLPLTPNPPTTSNAPEVDEVEFTLERTDVCPASVVVDWTLNPVPILIFPETPNPPTTVNEPEVDEEELIFESIDTAPTNVVVD